MFSDFVVGSVMLLCVHYSLCAAFVCVCGNFVCSILVVSTAVVSVSVALVLSS